MTERRAGTAIDNLWRMIETGQSVEMLTERLEQRREEKTELEKQLSTELNRKVYLSEPQVMAYIDYIRTMPLLDIEKRRAIINIFVHAVYLYDDHFTLIVNASTSPQREKDIPLDDIEKAFENNEEADCGTCSAVNDTVPPQKRRPVADGLSFLSRSR